MKPKPIRAGAKPKAPPFARRSFPPVYGRGQTRSKRDGSMNSLEQRYATELKARLDRGEIVFYAFEPVTLKLFEDGVRGVRYTPDFLVVLASGEVQFHEVKGHWEANARTKVKLAASLFPFRFLGVMPRRAKDGGGWDVEEFNPEPGDAAANMQPTDEKGQPT